MRPLTRVQNLGPDALWVDRGVRERRRKGLSYFVKQNSKDPSNTKIEPTDSSPEFDPYNIPFRGITMDPYLVLELFQVTDPAIQQAIKKLLRCGRKHKDADADCEEAITSLVRRREVKRILRENADTPQGIPS